MSSNAIAQFAQNNSQVLLHCAFIPHLETQRELELLSHELNRQVFKASFYELLAEKDERTLLAGAEPLEERLSLPHATVMHCWATADQVEDVIVGFRGAALQTTTPLSVHMRGTEFSPALPRFLMGSETDVVAWVNVNRDGKLMSFQDKLRSQMVHMGLTPITADGERWFPHFTLLAEPTEASDSSNRPIFFLQNRMPPVHQVSGHFFWGLSGPNGQFRGKLARVDEEVPPRVIRKKIGELLKLAT